MSVGVRLFSLTQHGSRFAVPAAKKVPEKSLLSRVFCDAGNPVSSYVNKTSGVDKALKTSIAAAEVAKGIIMQHGGSDANLATVSTVLSTLKDTRSVVGLTNALNGCIPGTVASVKNCFANLKYALSRDSQGVIDERNDGKVYNKQLLSKTEYLAAAVKSGCDAIGSGTFAITFGTLRPVLLADKLTHGGLVSKETKAGVTGACDYLMLANHISGVVGSSIGLGLENKQFNRALASLTSLSSDAEEAETLVAGERELLQADIEALKGAHKIAVRKGICGIVEKGLECVLDVLKFAILPISQPAILIIRGGIGMVVGGLGAYKVWSSDR